MESARPTADAVNEQVTARLSTLDAPRLVDELRTLLGARLVAYLVGASNTSTVNGHIVGAASIPDHAHPRLQAAYSVAALQYQLGATPALIQAWFQGRNPRLGDRSPAKVIADDPGFTHHALISAAVSAVRC
jgi:hypothetical protein